MKKPDDHTLAPSDHVEIRRHADLLLRKADAYGRLPTPVSDLVAAAKLSVEKGISLDEGFLRQFYKKATNVLRSALRKVLGFLDVQDRKIYLDHTVHEKKKLFVSLHDTGHSVLPWQRDAYTLVEEDEVTLDPDIQELFERQASVFASEVFFQLDAFQKQAADYPFSIRTPVQLAKKFGPSFYATVRRYVTTNAHACALVVLNRPICEADESFTATLRRCFQSPAFTQRFGRIPWPERYDLNHFFSAFFLGNARFGRPQLCQLRNLNNEPEILVAESFNSSYEIFILLYPEREFAGEAASFHP